MRLITRNDAALVAGLIAGTVVIFQRPFRFIWEATWDTRERYHVALLPALTIFAGVSAGGATSDGGPGYGERFAQSTGR